MNEIPKLCNSVQEVVLVLALSAVLVQHGIRTTSNEEK